MSEWIRPVTYAGLEVIPASLMIVTGHPWFGAGTFVAVLAATLVHSRRRISAEAALARRQLLAARPAPVRRPVPVASGDGVRISEDRQDRSLRAHDDHVIHFPPRRLPL